MKRILVQCVKELTQFRRDRLTVALAFLLPLISLFILSFAIRLEAKNIPIVVQDLNNTPLSRSYIERLFATNQFQATPWPGGDPVIHALDHGFAKAVVMIPPDFSRDIKSGRGSDVQILVDGTDTNNARVIQNSIHATTTAFLAAAGLEPGRNPLAPHLRIWFNPGRKESLYIVPGVFGFLLWVFPSLLAAMSMVREKEKGNIIQVYSTSMTATELILGKGLAYLIVSLGEALLLMVVGAFIFKLGFAGDPIPLLVGTPLYLAVSVMFGLAIGTRAKDLISTVQAVSLTGFMTALLLSGFIYPISNIPFPLNHLADIVPARYFIQISRDAFVRGTGWRGIWFSMLMIALLGLILFIVARLGLRKMQLPD
ncbi:ABC transporter [Nostoc sp. KVJ20]|uniref:ABC transporter permease n=1 Tax=Nostoc sp. KVJ20 TaxID=457944 RepID=UPI00083D8DEA|nr:ABC transporter permease [Nostoc sp. KVJ20]ODG98474.1 ABC transporter [Nostoc sp. KVJ20]